MTLENVHKYLSSRNIIKDIFSLPYGKTYSDIMINVVGKNEKYEKSNIIVDMKNKKIFVETWDESYHNGSSYNDKSYDADFDEYADGILSILIEKGVELMEKDEEELKQIEHKCRMFRSLSNKVFLNTQNT
jgi:hypothetical protein